MNILKSDILDPESSNAAVKLALAETHVIQETKTYLESQGVILSAFVGRARSETIILVKNIPYGTSAEQIQDLFSVYGVLARVLVPPAGTMAVVEFVHADEARTAFRSLVYRRLGNSVIYLEKGPLGMFQDAPPGDTITADGVGEKPIKIVDTDADEGTEPEMSAGMTLFVKNLSFATTTERLLQVFGHLPSCSFARVQMKSDPKRPGARLSMGYGFVGFKTIDAAKRALKSMQGHVLDGHALTVKFAGRGTDEKERKGKDKASTTKMLVKNLPFEATRKDVRELFGCVLFRACLGHRLILSMQRTRPTQVSPRTEEVRPPYTGLCVPRVHYTARGGKCLQRAGAHAFARSTPCARVGGRGRCGHRSIAEEGWCWARRRV
jgi:multiple RNA-binding domain-containing protein 1